MLSLNKNSKITIKSSYKVLEKCSLWKPQHLIYVKVIDTAQFCHEFLLNCLWNCESPQYLSHTTPPYFTQFPPHTQCSSCQRKKEIFPLYSRDLHNHGQNSSEPSPTNSILWKYSFIDKFQVKPLSVETPNVIFYYY